MPIAPSGAQPMSNMDPKLNKLIAILTEAKRLNCSDIHLAPGSPVMFRVDGVLVPMNQELAMPNDINE